MKRVLLGLICLTFQIQSPADEADKQGPRSLLPRGSGRNRAFEEGLVPAGHPPGQRIGIGFFAL